MKKIFTKPRLILLGKVAVFVAGLVAIPLIIATERIAAYFWGPGVIRIDAIKGTNNDRISTQAKPIAVIWQSCLAHY